jgi:hypothetical protein
MLTCAVECCCGCCCLQHVLMCIVILLGFPCWLIRHCSSGVPSALPLRLRSAAWRCALHIQFQLSYLLHTAQHRFRPTGSCCARAAGVAAQSLLSTSILHSFLQTSILCDQGEFWSSKSLAVWSCCCWQVRALLCNWDASKPKQQHWQLCLTVPATYSRLLCQHGCLLASCVDLLQNADATFVPYLAETVNACQPLLQQFLACTASLLLLFLDLVPEVHTYLFMLWLMCSCCCWVCS